MKGLWIALLSTAAFGQALTEPPPLIRLYRVDSRVAPGYQLIHAYSNSGANVMVLGMNAVSGPSETWSMELHGSFASIESVDKVLASIVLPERSIPAPVQDDVIPPSRSWIAVYRDGLSYRPDQAIRLFSTARYFQISIFRVRSGLDADFHQLTQIRKLGLDSINSDRPDIAYQVISGAPAGTYIFLTPLTSLRVLDNSVAKVPTYAEPSVEAARKIAADAGIMREHLIFRTEPRLSSVPDEFANADPAFWRPKAR